MVLTTEHLDARITSMIRAADKKIGTDGFVAGGLYGLRPSGDDPFIALAVSREVADEPTRDPSGVWLVPAPLRHNAPWVAYQFGALGVVAAVQIGEYWTFAPEDRQALEDFIAGRGVPASEHPNRQEGVFVAATWPAGGYSRAVTRRIVRAGGRAYLRPWPTGAESVPDDAPDAILDGVVSWLEQCLPHHDLN